MPPTTLTFAAFALCLEERPDRQANIERELTRAGLPFETLVSRRPLDAGGFGSPGIRGCLESHLRALELGLERNIDMVIVCEDDLWITRRFTAMWPSILTALSTLEWEFTHFGYLPEFYPSTHATAEPIAEHLGRLDAFELLCAHFYGVHRRVLPELVEDLRGRRHRPPYAPVDGQLNDFRSEHSMYPLVALPNLGIQMPSASNITPSTRAASKGLHSLTMLRPVLLGYRGLSRARFEFQTWRSDRARQPTAQR